MESHTEVTTGDTVKLRINFFGFRIVTARITKLIEGTTSFFARITFPAVLRGGQIRKSAEDVIHK